jgi:predicted O-linked N-acetylglucosamine transferase (SPINDLY family)
LDQAIDAYRRALAIDPGQTRALFNLGNALKDNGQLDEAIDCFRRALAICSARKSGAAPRGPASASPSHADDALVAEAARIADSLLIAILLHPDYDPARIAEEHANWEQKFAQPLMPPARSFPNTPEPGRRLRIAYVSSQFCDHTVGHFLWALLANHDPSGFEIFCYSNAHRSDWITERLRGAAGVWREVASLSDERLAAMIRQDQIDILVDSSMHTDGNRLLAFARKPAPVQVTGISYPGTTGLHAVDYRLSDPFLDPLPVGGAAAEQFYSERTIHLASSFWCYTSQEQLSPAAELPAQRNGYVTFGSLGSFPKVTQPTLKLWLDVLRNVEGSRLLILAPRGSPRERVLRQFQNGGIDPARIRFLDRQPRRQHMELYHQIDIGLDTFPYNGRTTTLDSLWMGVPVVSMSGRTAVSRIGLSILSNLGLGELCGATPESCIQIATMLARDKQRLMELRSTLRQRMTRSPLADGPRFARDLESCYRSMWSNWCESTSAASRGRSAASSSTGKTRFHVLILEPPEHPYHAAFYEVAHLLELSLRSLGHEVSTAKNVPDPDATNIVLGYQALDRPPDGSWIPFQLEQLYTHPRTTKWLEILAHAAQVWDYDPANIEFLRSHGITNVTHVPIGFHPDLRRIVTGPVDIDVLHYGSLTLRRRMILDELAKRCRATSLFNIYGPARDEAIARSKIVLNVHAYEGSVFEQARVSYLLNNARCVVTEDSLYNPYREMAVSCKYEELIGRCMSLLANDPERQRLAAEAAKKFETIPMTQILAAALARFPNE